MVPKLLLTNFVSKYPNLPAASEAKVLLGIAPAVIPTAVVDKAPVVVADDVQHRMPVLLAFKPTAPTKTGDFVYVVSKNKQVLCVKDSTGKVDRRVLDKLSCKQLQQSHFMASPHFY